MASLATEDGVHTYDRTTTARHPNRNSNAIQISAAVAGCVWSTKQLTDLPGVWVIGS
jgi:hypothetical protein